jgi:hypothetical protein
MTFIRRYASMISSLIFALVFGLKVMDRGPGIIHVAYGLSALSFLFLALATFLGRRKESSSPSGPADSTLS